MEVSGKTRVCIKHFDDKDIKRSDIFKCRNGDSDIIKTKYRQDIVPDSYDLLNIHTYNEYSSIQYSTSTQKYAIIQI